SPRGSRCRRTHARACRDDRGGGIPGAARLARAPAPAAQRALGARDDRGSPEQASSAARGKPRPHRSLASGAGWQPAPYGGGGRRTAQPSPPDGGRKPLRRLLGNGFAVASDLAAPVAGRARSLVGTIRSGSAPLLPVLSAGRRPRAPAVRMARPRVR